MCRLCDEKDPGLEHCVCNKCGSPVCYDAADEDPVLVKPAEDWEELLLCCWCAEAYFTELYKD